MAKGYDDMIGVARALGMTGSEETERDYRLYCNLAEIVSQGREASTELVTAAREVLADVEREEGITGRECTDLSRLRAALEPFVDVLGVDELPLPDC